MNVTCINEECSEFDILKDNSNGFPTDEIQCGKCGGPVAEVPEADENG